MTNGWVENTVWVWAGQRDDSPLPGRAEGDSITFLQAPQDGVQFTTETNTAWLINHTPV